MTKITRRRGQGMVLLLIIGLLVILFVIGVAMLYFSGHVFHQAARGAGGMACEYLAESAIDDLFFQIQKDLNDRSSPIFQEIRDVLLVRERETFDLSNRYKPRNVLAAQKSSADGKFLEQLAIERTSAILRVNQTAPDEEPQMMILEADVRLSLGRESVFRRVRIERRVGITLVAPHRPFDQVPFAIVESPVIADVRAMASRLDAAIRTFNRTGELLQGWKFQVEGKPLGVPMTATLPPLKVGDEVEIPSSSYLLFADESYVFPAVWEEVAEDSVGNLLPPDDSVLFASKDEEVSLPDFNYYRRIEDEIAPLQEKLRQSLEEFTDAFEPLAGAAGEKGLSASVHDEWAEAMGEAAEKLHEILENLQQVLKEIALHMKQHSRDGMTTETTWKDKHYESAAPIYPLAHHFESIAGVEETLRSWPAVGGHMAINPTDVSGRAEGERGTFTASPFRGRAVLSAQSGTLQLGKISLDVPGKDRLVIVASGIRLVEPEIEAGIVVRERFETKVPAKVHGSVILLRYPRPERGEEPPEWKGTVRYDDGLDSGRTGSLHDLSQVKLDRYVVSLNPRVERKEVLWQP